ncbi:MAG: hypothetical protein ACLQAN_02820 [Acidimicrobiales bacterium]
MQSAIAMPKTVAQSMICNDAGRQVGIDVGDVAEHARLPGGPGRTPPASTRARCLSVLWRRPSERCSSRIVSEPSSHFLTMLRLDLCDQVRTLDG